LLGAVLFYVILLGLTFMNKRLSDGGRRVFSASPALISGALLVLATLTVVVWRLALNAPDGRLHLTVLDVGSGDALLVGTPGGHNLLVGGGPRASLLSDALGRRLIIGNRKLDFLVVAAADDEQLGALRDAVGRFPPDQVLWSGPPVGSSSALQLKRDLSEAQIPVIIAQAGHALDLGSGARLLVLEVNHKGSVLLLEWGSFRALLPVGLNFESMESLMVDHSQGPVSVLLLAESGLAALNTPEWITRWRPQLVLLSVGAGDSKGRPDPETLAAIDGYALLRTDINGWIHLSTDGESLWVEVEQE